jgi:NADPH:quinone reductase-like Zn-dependent oxidoreductase
VIVGGEGGGRLTGGFERQLRAVVLSRFVSQRLVALTAVDRRADLLFLKDVIEDGKLTPVIDRTFALGEAAHALTDAQEGHGRGKKVIVT